MPTALKKRERGTLPYQPPSLMEVLQMNWEIANGPVDCLQDYCGSYCSPAKHCPTPGQHCTLVNYG